MDQDVLIKISDLPEGMIIWHRGEILGITRATLQLKYYKYYVRKIKGNRFDYELVGEEI